MLLAELIEGVPTDEVHGSLRTEIRSVHTDSRLLSKGDLFVALSGRQGDDQRCLAAALEAGAAAVVCERLPKERPSGVPFVRTTSSRLSLARIAANHNGNPARALKLVGVTGTNGKTTIATLLHGLFMARGEPSGLVSTVRNLVNTTEVPATHTTPEPLELHSLLRRMLEDGCRYVFMEVTSYAIAQERLGGLEFDGAIFTNLSRDHLNYHGTMEAYAAAKERFFASLPESAFALVNRDDAWSESMVRRTSAHVAGYSLDEPSDYRCDSPSLSRTASGFQLREVPFRSALLGRFNLYNAAAVLAAAHLLGLPLSELPECVSKLEPPAGRFEVLETTHGVFVIVDFAHTPDAVTNVLEAARGLLEPGGRLIAVVGCGGDKDRGKRPEMAASACRVSDAVILTSDNPRSEDPHAILEGMLGGVPSGYESLRVIPDRRQAIEEARTLAQPGDSVVIAGKGHETFQEIQGQRFAFSDVEEVRRVFGTLPPGA